MRVAGIDESRECVSSSLDLFSDPLVEASIDHTYFSVINPLAPLSDSSSQISFQIPPCEGRYTIMNKQIDRQSDRQSDSQTVRQTDKQRWMRLLFFFQDSITFMEEEEKEEEEV